jgi:hypothetical protein
MSRRQVEQRRTFLPLNGELRTALSRGVRDRNTRIHLEDAVVRIDKTLERCRLPEA